MRKSIGDAFRRYKGRCESDLWPQHGALEHWAKVEGDARVQERLTKRLGDDALTRFADARKTYDPQRLLSNPLLDGIFPTWTVSDGTGGNVVVHDFSGKVRS